MSAFTVGELIKELSKYPEDAWIYLSKEGCTYSWSCTRVDDDDLEIDACMTLSNE